MIIQTIAEKFIRNENFLCCVKILVVNCGSTSIKYKVFSYEKGEFDLLCSGIVERIGEEVSYFRYKSKRGRIEYERKIKDHSEGFGHVLRALTDPEKGVIEKPREIVGVGHRVVHGGEEIVEPVVIDEKVEEVIEKYQVMAPLHNPANLVGIRILKEIFPDAVHVAVFDTAFHATLPEEAYVYAIPYEYYERYRIRRYGFHGTSHGYVARKAAEILGRPLEELRIITCHLGAGCSMAAVKYGKSIDTSMGLTPLEGLVMATRCGDIDPSIVYFLVKWTGMSLDDVYKLLNEKSGLLGISGISKDLRLVKEAADRGDRRAELAIRIFAYRVKKYIGAYAAAMGGVDAIVFTAGIGERAPWMRELILEGLEFLGIKIDTKKNQEPEKYGGVVSSDDSKIKILVIPTDEERAIAEETVKRIRTSR